MVSDSTELSQATPTWRGFHHIALLTTDLNATIHFYQDVLGMQPSRILPGNELHGRHCFLKPGLTESWGLHFFEQADAKIFTHPEALERFVFVAGAMQHIAFALPDEPSALELRERLSALAIPMTEIMDQGPVRNMLFKDNNGILLEATWAKT